MDDFCGLDWGVLVEAQEREQEQVREMPQMRTETRAGAGEIRAIGEVEP